MSLREYWIRWKALRLPWRRKFLVGMDLNQNQYWEFKDALSSIPGRMRRIVKSPSRVHHSDVQQQISPLWHQWLRHTRQDPPSLQEQQLDVQRQITLRHNAMLADERWNAKKKYIESPAKSQEPQQAVADSSTAPRQEMERRAGLSPTEKAQPDPWRQEREHEKSTASNPGGTWQPEAWTPPPRQR